MEDALSSSRGRRLVPWQSWNEWRMVKENLFSSSPFCKDIALKRIKAWESRGCLPIPVAITAEIVEAQQMDPHFRKGVPGGSLNSEKMLCLLYSMAIMRLVNGVVDQSQDKAKDRKRVSIAKAADEIGLPRMLIDIRHESSHRGLPSLKLLHFAIEKALNWLIDFYWERQVEVIPDILTDINSTLRRMAYYIQVKAKKEMSKTLRSIILAYSSYPTEITTLILENCLCNKSLLSQSPEVVMISEDSPAACGEPLDRHIIVDLDCWKRIIKKLSRKRPDFLLVMFKVALDKIDAVTAQEPTDDQCDLITPFDKDNSKLISDIASLAAWVLECLKDLICSDTHQMGCRGVKDAVLRDQLQDLFIVCTRKLTHIASLSDPCLVLSHLIGKESLTGSINKLAEIGLAKHDFEVDIFDEELKFEEEEETLSEATRSLELLKRCRQKNKTKVVKKEEAMWTVAKSWQPCPIGKLPSLSSTGRLATLDRFDGGSAGPETTTIGCKRDSTYELESSELPDNKRMRESMMPIGVEYDAVDSQGQEAHDVVIPSPNVDDTIICEAQPSPPAPATGFVLIDGSLQHCGPDMLQSIQSKICIFNCSPPDLKT